jgi:hypothetical protein
MSEIVDSLERGEPLTPEMGQHVATALIHMQRQTVHAKEFDVREISRKMKERGSYWIAENDWVVVDRAYFWKMQHTQ